MCCSQSKIKKSNKILSSNSTSSSSSSSSYILPLTPRRSMDEVWKDITLSTFHNEIPSTPPLFLHHLPRSSGIILQDFLAGPYKEAPPPPLPPHHHQPPIDLNLDSSCHLDIISSFCPNRKRAVEQQMSDGFGNDEDSGNRRQKRMIKNRESAARSRARKQAYTNELELEVAHLVQENTKLRRQCEELSLAMSAQIPTKRTLQRASSAPF